MPTTTNGYYMELQQLRLFLAAAESKSFTRGAKRAFVSQPALSASIAKLEGELGVRLFTRNKRSVVLTPAGQTLLKRATQIVNECNRARDELKNHDQQRMLRLGVVNTLSITNIARLIEPYRRENSSLKLQVFDASSEEMERLAVAGRIDLSLTILPEHPEKGRQVSYSKRLFSESYKVAMATSHHLSEAPSLCLADLENEPFVSRSHCEYRQMLKVLMKTAGVRLNVAYITDQDDRALSLVEQGAGIAIVPEHYESLNIVKRPITELSATRSIGFEWGESENQAEIDRFIAFASSVKWPE
ncbi:LysR family transcriptional regulator [Marinobacter maritimus]|uniref:LysR family transcriptional regulator n=1 Tax=Marinobacter maritimus TaxID=277961 RepID=UPI001FEB6569|nr:LysR family transcriptional regulator [Marinobacter maritimus]